MANENPKLTITLTGRAPVTINKDDWPVIASADEKEWDNHYESQANRTAKWKLTVRQHADGRTIVYGVHSFSSQFQSEHGRDVRGGELIQVKDADADCVGDADLIIAAIQRVATDLELRMPDGDKWSRGVFPRLAHECTADLPAVEL